MIKLFWPPKFWIDWAISWVKDRLDCIYNLKGFSKSNNYISKCIDFFISSISF